jgi:hypothetical protein
MANFNYLDFFKTPSGNDAKLFIKDINNNIVWSLSPFKIKSSIIQNNNIRINFTNGDFILIDFNNVYESKYALTTLQNAINNLRDKIPNNIDKDVELYVHNLKGDLTVNGNIYASNSIYLNGLTFSSDGEKLTVWGDIIPSSDNIYNLGSYDFQWHSLYVGSSSVYIGGVTLSAYNDTLYVDNINITGDILKNSTSIFSYFSATSSTALQIPDIGENVILSVPSKMSWTPMQSLLVYANLIDNYMVDDYVEGDSSAYFIASVDSYDSNSGTLSVVVDYSNGYGITISGTSSSIVPTYSLWYINITGKSGEINPNYLLDNDYKFNFFNGEITTFKSDLATNSVINNTFLKGTTKFQKTIEFFNTSTASNVITYDFNLGSIWYHDNLAENYEAAFINVPTDNNTIITQTIIINQSTPAYIPTSISINGSTYDFRWSNGSSPEGTSEQVDIIGITFIFQEGTPIILAQLSTYAQVV